MTAFFKHKLRKKSPAEIVATIIFGGIFITGLIILFAYVFMWLWNWLMPELFGLGTLTFWKAAGLLLLAKIIFGGFNGCGSRSSRKSCKEEDKDSKTDFSKWKYYDQFWKEEGDEYYRQYVQRQTRPAQDDIPSNNDNQPT